MPHGVHNNPFVGWNPPADLAEWLEAEVERRGGKRGIRSALLTEALADLRAKHRPAPPPVVAAEEPQPQKAGRNCKHRNMRGHKGVCPDCHEWVVKP